MAGGSFIGEQDFGPYQQQVNPAMAQYFQTMRSLEASRSRLMEVSQGVVGAMPGAVNVAQQGLAQTQRAFGMLGAQASAFHGGFVSGYQTYQGPLTAHQTAGLGTQLATSAPLSTLTAPFTAPFAPFAGAIPGSQGMFIQGRYGYEGGAIAQDMLMQNLNIGARNAARTAATDIAPNLMMMGGALYGGPLGMAVAGVGAIGAMGGADIALRATGADAWLNKEHARRTIQRALGSRLGDLGGAERFRVGRGTVDEATEAYTEFVQDVQSQYGLFAPGEEEFRPLLGAAIQTTKDQDLPRLIKKGADGLKERLQDLRTAAAELNMQYNEVAELAVEFGEEGGVGGTFEQFMGDVSRAATRGRGLNRRMLASLAIQQRNQAISRGFQGESAQRGVMELAADIQQQANLGLIPRDELFMFGGRTQAEAAMNTAVARQNMEFQMAEGPFGQMALARQISGRRVGGGLMQNLGGLGQTFAQDPFGFMAQNLRPGARSAAAREAPWQMFRQFKGLFGGGDAARVLFSQSLAQQTGMSPQQASAMFSQFQRDERIAAEFGESLDLKADTIVQAAINARAVDPGMTVQGFTQLGLNRGQVEEMASGRAGALFFEGIGTRGGVGRTILSDEEIRQQAEINALAANPEFGRKGFFEELEERAGPMPTSDKWTWEGFKDRMARGAREAGALGGMILEGYGAVFDKGKQAEWQRAVDREEARIRKEQDLLRGAGTSTQMVTDFLSRSRGNLRTLGLIDADTATGELGQELVRHLTGFEGDFDLDRLAAMGVEKDELQFLRAMRKSYRDPGGATEVALRPEEMAERFFALNQGETARLAINELMAEGEDLQDRLEAADFIRDGLTKEEMRKAENQDAIQRLGVTMFDRGLTRNRISKLLGSVSTGILQPVLGNQETTQQNAFSKLSNLSFDGDKLRVTTD